MAEHKGPQQSHGAPLLNFSRIMERTINALRKGIVTGRDRGTASKLTQEKIKIIVKNLCPNKFFD